MRRSFDGLATMVQEILHQNPLAGHLFVFINKRSDRTKLLYWDTDGFAIWYKRLEKGTFTLPAHVAPDHQLSTRVLSMLLEGVDFKEVQLKKRFQLEM
jgi:transposase